MASEFVKIGSKAFHTSFETLGISFETLHINSEALNTSFEGLFINPETRGTSFGTLGASFETFGLRFETLGITFECFDRVFGLLSINVNPPDHAFQCSMVHLDLLDAFLGFVKWKIESRLRYRVVQLLSGLTYVMATSVKSLGLKSQQIRRYLWTKGFYRNQSFECLKTLMCVKTKVGSGQQGEYFQS